MTTTASPHSPARRTPPRMTDDQRFFFDLKGWLVIPAVLTSEEIAACKAHIDAWMAVPSKLPEHHQNTFSGACSELLDHPVLVGILREIVAPDLMSPMWEPVEHKDMSALESREGQAYSFRCDNSFLVIRKAGQTIQLGAHNGGPSMGPSHHYQFHQGRIFSPATRVVWELNAVKKDGGGTPFLSGSHKSNYNVTPTFTKAGSPGWESYECPAGSLVIFTENVCHGSATWTDPTQPRMAIFSHYMHYGMRFHRSPPPARVTAEMPPLRQTLFRDVWMFEQHAGKVLGNAFYDADNRARTRGE